MNANEKQAPPGANANERHNEGTLGNIIRVVGIDPSLANFGVARMFLDLDSLAISLDEIRLISTERRSNKTVRQNSDDLRRGRELQIGFNAAIDGCDVIFAEIPSGAQSSRATMGFGISIGVLAGCTLPLIEVQPKETKICSVGSATATKPQIIAWAAGLYPDAGWQLYAKEVVKKGVIVRKKGDLHDDNEHTADGCAIVHAGIKTREFLDLRSMLMVTSKRLNAA